MVIRPAVPSDAPALTDLHLDVWEQAYAGLIDPSIIAGRRADREARVERWRSALADGPFRNLVAEDPALAGRLLGFATTGPGRDAPEEGLPGLELMSLYVRAEAYGIGLGHALCRATIGDAAAYLWVLDGNARAIGFYERQGFGFDGRTKVEPVGVERRMVRTAAAER